MAVACRGAQPLADDRQSHQSRVVRVAGFVEKHGLLEEHLVDSAQVAAAACDATHAANDAVLAAVSVVQAAIEVRTAFILVIVQSIDVGSREQSIDVGSRDAAAAVAEQYAGS